MNANVLSSNQINSQSNLTTDKLSILCFSHLRWEFVFQRPQHLLTLASETYPVLFFEEPVFKTTNENHLEIKNDGNVTVYTPVISPEHNADLNILLENLIIKEIKKQNVENYISWYYTPMAISFTKSLTPELIIFDCMDELSAFDGAPAEMIENEKILLEKADIVFTGGRSLYESKKTKRADDVYLFPSSIDVEHYASGKMTSIKTTSGFNQINIGYFGVIDERFDINLLDQISKLKPEWHFIIVGPVVKISPNILPRRDNIFYTGQQSYNELPETISNWDAAIIPFARNKSTEYISPTKVLEYLAAGKPVVSTSIRDIIVPYGVNNIVKIADEPQEFVNALENSLDLINDKEWLNKVNMLLDKTSWKKTWKEMNSIIHETLTKTQINKKEGDKKYV